MLAIAGQEFWLASRGFVPTVVDSASSWAHERERASTLGSDALILVGSSRMQLDVDLGTLGDLTGRPTVQLAIDGSSFVPVLADLAADDRVRGAVVVDYQDHVVGDVHRHDSAETYLAEWNRVRDRPFMPDFATTEKVLSGFVHDHLRSFADGASPFDSLTLRLLDPQATPQYLITLPGRERRANYARVQMPQFYFARVMRNAGITQTPQATSWREFNDALARQIDTLSVSSMPAFATNAATVAGYVRQIERRGGHVVFVMFPRSGLVRAADERLFPRGRYWSAFAKAVETTTLDYRDVPAMATLVCPDGSHLDESDQVTFTRALVNAVPALREGNMAGAARVASRNASEE
ncbi:hypothetical protein [Luteibacter sp. UNCMF331Sha3.1]|uniref:hypothetical protein n=1 Tax=Luteibacter sp. UNCMF331Sha3.1 TaxID=1502760 RepID=UPI000B7FD832|nr:hypothetical protein [Luteibacter sp. UNCMF331Sha3.1]